MDERRIAVRELADILEHLKPTALSLLDKRDESDLFNIANNFGIRHANNKQRINYDPGIWLSWMFHFYLATIHACVRLEEKRRPGGDKSSQARDIVSAKALAKEV